MVPLLAMTISLIISGTASFFVPETVNKDLLNTLSEAERTWGSKTKQNLTKTEENT